MYPLVETIKILNGVPQNLFWHQKRYDHSIKLVFGHPAEVRLEEVLEIPDRYRVGKVRARLLYDDKGFSTEFQEYAPLPVRSLKLVVSNDISYSFKYTDRRPILKMLERKGECDDILIVKNRRITDSSIANIVFYDGEKWITPEDPLLKGTAREKLLSEGRIISNDIQAESLKSFMHFRLINSMLDFEEQESLDISNIK